MGTKAATRRKPSRNGKPRPKKPKQLHFEGMEPPRIPELDGMADQLVEARKEKKQATDYEKDRADLLWAAMRKHGLTRYEYEGGTVELETKDKVKVTAKGGKAVDDGF